MIVRQRGGTVQLYRRAGETRSEREGRARGFSGDLGFVATKARAAERRHQTMRGPLTCDTTMTLTGDQQVGSHTSVTLSCERNTDSPGLYVGSMPKEMGRACEG